MLQRVPKSEARRREGEVAGQSNTRRWRRRRRTSTHAAATVRSHHDIGSNARPYFTSQPVSAAQTPARCPTTWPGRNWHAAGRWLVRLSRSRRRHPPSHSVCRQTRQFATPQLLQRSVETMATYCSSVVTLKDRGRPGSCSFSTDSCKLPTMEEIQVPYSKF